MGGLNAQSFALENISGNIANAQTTAFKRTDTSFYDLIASGASKVSLMTAGNVRAAARSTINIQGSIEASATETFLAVKGNGFFVVKQRRRGRRQLGLQPGRALYPPRRLPGGP